MPKLSAGLLLYRKREDFEVFLVHPGGPFWKNKDAGAWSIPKGEYGPEEDAWDAAVREFTEETGFELPQGTAIELEPLKQKSGKIVTAWALEADLDASGVQSNTFTLEWPPKSGNMQEFPEVDKAAWFEFNLARAKIAIGQVGFLDQLAKILRIQTAS